MTETKFTENKRFFFISGLPRSGSTLLCNILAQNPKFHATETSGCLDVLFGLRNVWNTLVEHRASPCPQRLQRVLRAAFEAYHAEQVKPVVFDKSRGWIAYLELIENVLEDKVKVLVPVRPVVDILTSFETLFRETAKVKQPPGEAENYFQFQTVAGRCEFWMRPDQPVGLALNRLGDVTRRGLQDRLHFVQFDRLTSNPKQKLKEIYDFLGEEYFEHNFDHVEQVTQEDDEIHGFVNLHKIRNKVEPVKSRAREVLGEEIIKRFAKAT
jgi:sulfotransferase